MSINLRLKLLTAVLILIIAIASLIGIVSMNKIGNELGDIAETDIPLTAVLGELEVYQLEQEIFLEKMMRAADVNSGQADLKSLENGLLAFNDKINEEIKRAVEIGQKMVAAKDEHSRQEGEKVMSELKKIVKESAEYQKALSELVGKINSGNLPEAEALAGKVEKEADTLTHELEALHKAGGQFTEKSAKHAEETEHTAIRMLIAFFVLGSLFGAGFAFYIIRSIIPPLAKMQDTLVHVEQTGDLTLRANIASQDEVGRTAAAFDKMMAKIAALVGDTRQSAEAIAAAAQSMATAGVQVEKSSSAQSEAASAVAAAVEQTSVSISETASNAKNADETATRARTEIEYTLAAVRETAANVDALAGMIGKASGDIAHLAESSRHIYGIVQTIKDIADQTNLLALNAAIEAARAGEQGRGFAVVADEVRKLAEKTTSATIEISGLITGIQSEVDDAVARMQQANDKAGSTRDRVVASTGALDAASANTDQVTESVRSIAGAVREQDVAVQEVAQRMEQIAQMTEENTAAAGNAADTARQLDGLAGKLREAVGRFRV